MIGLRFHRGHQIGILALAGLGCAIGCGKKGPPLPPLVRAAQAPADFAAARRDAEVAISFVVPKANTDGTKPANARSIQIYALNSPSMLPPEEVLARGTRVATLDVKGPRNADDVIRADEPDENMEPLEGTGSPQGVAVRLTDDLPAASLEAAGAEPLRRLYVGVAVGRNGRRGLLSQLAVVPLGAAPSAPAELGVVYDESALTLTWEPPADRAPNSRGEFRYHVYDVSTESAASPQPKVPPTPDVRLTKEPVSESRFVDARVEWGVRRCYVVRTVDVRGDLRIESAGTPPACVTPVDTFPPATPTGFETSPAQGAVRLVWDANREKDLAGYVVLRGESLDEPPAAMTAITPMPIQETGFTDALPSGTRRVYAVRAIDKAGNMSAPTIQREEGAR